MADTIMDDILRPHAEWVITRGADGNAIVSPWQPGHPYAGGGPAPHTEIHEHWDATPTRERTLKALHGNKAKPVASHFLDAATARAALQAGLATPQGRALLDGVLGPAGTSNAVATMPLSGTFVARFIYRSSGVIRTTEIIPAAGIFAKLIRAGAHTAYVQTHFPVPPVPLA